MIPMFESGGNLKVAAINQTVKGIKIFQASADNVSNHINKGRFDCRNLTSDLPTYGAELMDASGWTSTGWTGSWAGGWVHTAGNTSALSRAITGISSGKIYKVVYTCAGRTAGSYTMSVGGMSFGGSHTANGTNTAGPIASSSAGLVVTPTTDFDGTLTINIVEITAASAPAARWLDTADASRLEFRAGAVAGNIFLGKTTGRYHITGTGSVGFGITALQNLTNGSGNTAFGSGALATVSVGSSNTAVGSTALAAMTTGGSNTGFGANALAANTTGSSNVGVGVGALLANTTGSNNVAMGVNAMNAAGTFGSCTAIGAVVLSSNTASNNTAIGYRAGTGISGSTTACSTGTPNTFLGMETGFQTSTQRNYVICIGYRAQADADNACIIGGTSTAAVNVGIGGVQAPGARLDVLGAGTTTGLGLRITNSAGTPNLTIRDDGGFAFRGGTVGVAQTGYAVTNPVTRRSFDTTTITLSQLAEVVGTIIADDITKGIRSA